MNIINVIEDIKKFDPEVYERLGSRRAALNSVGKMGMKAALAAVPLALGSMFNKAYAKGAAHEGIVEVLNFALTLEYLEFEFYDIGLKTPALITGNARNIMETIRLHEKQHVEFLLATIKALGGTPVAKPTFDFTAGGAFATFRSLPTFLVLSQAFEDTGVRAYKGQAANLISNDAVLTAALQIHSVEARHAARVRDLRGQKGWIVGSDGGNMPAATNAVYAGEDNLVQAGVNLQSALPSYSVADLTAAFDEPLTKEEVLAIAGLFIV
jgi:rubrerythrin